jgi:hypothetical protein
MFDLCCFYEYLGLFGLVGFLSIGNFDGLIWSKFDGLNSGI